MNLAVLAYCSDRILWPRIPLFSSMFRPSRLHSTLSWFRVLWAHVFHHLVFWQSEPLFLTSLNKLGQQTPAWSSTRPFLSGTSLSPCVQKCGREQYRCPQNQRTLGIGRAPCNDLTGSSPLSTVVLFDTCLRVLSLGNGSAQHVGPTPFFGTCFLVKLFVALVGLSVETRLRFHSRKRQPGGFSP